MVELMRAAKDFCVKHAIPLVIKIHPDLKGKADWPEQMGIIEGLSEEARAQVRTYTSLDLRSTYQSRELEGATVEGA